MILINLLPYRQERRLARKRHFYMSLLLSAISGLGLVVVASSTLAERTFVQEQRNAFLQTEIAKLDAQIRDVTSLRVEIDALKARLQSIEDLQTDRNIPVHLLNEVAGLVPEGMHLKSLVQSGADVVLSGVAHSSDRVSEFLRNVAASGEWLERPELIEVKAVRVEGQPRELGRTYEFSVRLKVKRSVPVRVSGQAASSPSP